MMTRTFQKLKVISLVALAATPAFAQQTGRPELTNLVLELKVDKTDYLPGELIELRFRLAARSGAALAPTRISVTDGSLGILVSQGSGAYLEYQGPEWGTKKTSLPGVVALSGDQAIEATATLLYNAAPETAHLSPIYAQQLLEGRIPREYALAEAGSFLLKAVYYDRYSGDRLESDPLQINVAEPAGENAEVWNTLRANPKLGYLLQTGVLPGAARESEEDEAIAILDDLLSRHRTSAYARHIDLGLRKFRRLIQTQRNN